ncbi:phage tail protein [Pseudomonas mosselii]|uniref:phage tail protein n=1 Tax=Pseudomonas mosselii TaxID=78327 RepID=UPI002174DD02|nr:phage tail protein [Pseudomonas mosselii]
MTDQNSQFFAILTAIGEAKQANADALGVPWTFAQMGVGDANDAEPTPSRTQTKLINERRRAPLNTVKVDPTNANIIIAEQVIPPDVGGWWIREIGLYDAAGDLVAVANCAPSFKPLLSQGTGKTQIVRLNLIVSSTANVELKIDPSVVLATRAYVDTSILSVLPLNKTPGTYTKVRTNDRGVVQEGFNPTTLAGYNITDAMAKGAGGLMTTAPVVTGKLSDLAETQFFASTDLTTDKPAAVSYATGLHIKYPGDKYGFDLLSSINTEWFGIRYINKDAAGEWRQLWHEGNFTPANKANLAGATFTGPVRFPDIAVGNSSDLGANSKFVMAAITTANAAVVGSAPAAMDTLQKLAAALGNDPNFATTITTLIAGKAAKATTLGGYGIADAYSKTETDALLAALLPKRSFAANDFIRIPDVIGGLVIQMGTTLVGPEATVDVTLPLTFNAGRGAIAGVTASSATTQGNISAYATLVSNSVIRVTQDINMTAAGANQYINWLAWGY